MLKPVSSCLFAAWIIASSAAARAGPKEKPVLSQQRRSINSPHIHEEIETQTGMGGSGKHQGCPVLVGDTPAPGNVHPNHQKGNTKHRVLPVPVPASSRGHNKSLVLLIAPLCYIRERRAASASLSLWGTVSLRPTRYNARTTLSNPGLVFVVLFFKTQNFPEAIYFYSAHRHIQYCRHRVHLGKAKAKKKKQSGFLSSLSINFAGNL